MKLYPDHIPPTPPENHVWVYRGLGWRSKKPVSYYVYTPDKKTGTGDGFSRGNAHLHYFEAVPSSGESDDEFFNDPKGEAASHKAPLHFLPSYPLHETAHVMKHGAAKYGRVNWRTNKVCASTYRAVMGRHLDQWFDGKEDADEETQRSHLAHVIASACIVLDAMKHGTLVDDRP